jgi:hypothetical protein
MRLRKFITKWTKNTVDPTANALERIIFYVFSWIFQGRGRQRARGAAGRNHLRTVVFIFSINR